jgi:hypothetical protein
MCQVREEVPVKKTAAKGHTHKHAGGHHKHAGHHSKHHPVHHHKGATAHGHHVHTVARHPSHPKARGLALGEGVACCSAEALAASLRLAGGVVDDDDVLELHWRAGGTADEGVSVLAALEAAAEFGLAGYRPAKVINARLEDDLGVTLEFKLHADEDIDVAEIVAGLHRYGHDTSVILGLELPGPHAVLAEPGRWWSWGERYDPSDFPYARVEECWAVAWTG